MIHARRQFLKTSGVAVLGSLHGFAQGKEHAAAASSAADGAQMRALIDWTYEGLQTKNPTPFGALIASTATGEVLLRAVNTVGPAHDPSSHGEVHAIRLASAAIGDANLHGYTLYTTCEPCPMCMACCLWAGLDRVVYAATIEDAAKYGPQIMIPAAEVARRTDMHCEVTGPVERERAQKLFDNEIMKPIFERWKKAR